METTHCIKQVAVVGFIIPEIGLDLKKKQKKNKHSDCISKVGFFCLFIDLNKLNKGWGVIVFTL